MKTLVLGAVDCLSPRPAARGQRVMADQTVSEAGMATSSE